MNRIFKSVIIVIFICLNISNADTLQFTSEEKQFIKSNRVKVALLPSFYPFSFSQNGKNQGLSYDLLNIISDKSGLKFDFLINSWHKNFTYFKEQKIDIIDAISYNKTRSQYTNFTKPYFEVPLVIYSNKDLDTYNGTLESLKGKRVGITKDIFYAKFLEDLQLFEIFHFNSVEEKLQALSNKEVDLAIGGFLNAKNILRKLKLSNLRILDEVHHDNLKKEDLRFGVHKSNPVLFSILNKTYRSLNKQQLKTIRDKWLGIYPKEIQKSYEGEIILNKEEQNFLKNTDVIRMCNHHNFEPIEFVNEKGEAQGISVDTIRLIEKKLNYNLLFEHVNTQSEEEARELFEKKVCDILPTTMENIYKENHQYTQAYLDYQAVLITRSDEPFIYSMDDIKYKGVSIKDDERIIKHVKGLYPGITIIKTKSHEESFEKVSSGEVYSTITNLPMASYYITKYGFSNLKIAGHAKNNLRFKMAVNAKDKLLVSILNKALTAITQREKAAIFNKWANIKLSKDINYSTIMNIAFVASFLIILLVYRQIMLSKNNEKLRKSKIKLEESNALFQVILEASAEGILITDKKGVIIECNKMCSQLFGYKKEELLGMHILDIVEKSHRKKIKENRTRHKASAYEIDIINKKKKNLPVLIRSSNIIQNGQEQRVSIILNLTELKKTQHALETLNKDLAIKVIEEVEKNKRKDLKLLHQARHAQMGELINMIAHQWRQPLNAIAATIMNVQLQLSLDKFDLNNQNEQEKFKEFINLKLANMEDFIQTLSVTIDDFRNFYKQDNQVKTESVHIPIKKALSIVKALILSNKIEIVQKFESKKTIEIYESELLQVFLNVIKNAQDNFEDRETKDPCITIITKDISTGVLVEITDNGGGIKPTVMDNIFDPYFSTKNVKNGTGLGLYMSKSIIEKHHKGKLFASNKNKGVCFSIELHNNLK